MTTSVSPLEGALFAGGFTQAQSLRVRTGDVLIDGPVRARTFDLSADSGNIEVNSAGSIDASGATGGTIELDAGGSVTLDGGSMLSVQGMNFDDAGQGGTVTLQAGSYSIANTSPPTDLRDPITGLFDGGGAVNISAASTIDLSIVNNHALQLNPGGSSSLTPAGSIAVPAGVAVFFPSGTPGNDTVAFGSGGTVTGPDGSVITFSGSPLKPFVTSIVLGSSVTLSSPGTISFGGGTGGSVPVNLPSQLGGGGTPNLAAVNITDLGAYNATGVLNIIAPQVFDLTGNPLDVRVDPIAGNVVGASSFVVEGVNVYDLTPRGGGPATIDGNVEAQVQANGALFAGGFVLNPDGSTTTVVGNTANIVSALTGANPGLGALMHVRPVAEIVNTNGDLDLTTTWDFAQGALYSGSGDSSLAANWSSLVMPFRFGPNGNEPGSLILRASGNVALGYDSGNGTYGSLNDGFAGFDGVDNTTLMLATMLPAGSQSWSFRVVAGADFTAADSTQVLPEAALASAQNGKGAGSILLGSGISDLLTREPNNPWDYFETIRTGTGSIGLYAGLDTSFLNNLFAVYTVGTQTAPVPDFDVPVSGAYPAQYSAGGGNVIIVAQGSIEHLNAEGQPDSSKELPQNWLASQGSVDANGQFSVESSVGDSTSWWVDFGNFFEGVGALGGGNVTLLAGGNISNVDALIPTNERTAKRAVPNSLSSAVDLLAADQPTLELGGGDLLVQAGQDIDGGVYYVERGDGSLTAAGSIHSNVTRSALKPSSLSADIQAVNNPQSWLPTTLFLGDGNFTIQGGGNVLLGPIANPFLLPLKFPAAGRISPPTQSTQ